jgi:hypothetical protein
MTLASNGSSVYLIFVLINSLAFPHRCGDPIQTVPFSLGKLNTGFEITPYEYMAYDMVESTEGSFQAACRECIMPTEAGIQKGPTGFRVTHGMTSQSGGRYPAA